MLPFVLLFAGGSAVTDVAATAAVTEGLNDNVIQTTNQKGDIDRHPQTFSGLDTSLFLRFAEPNGDMHGFRARVRGQFYQSLDGFTPADPDYTAQGSWQSTFAIAKFTTLNLSLSSTISALTSARVGDATLFFTIDPASTQTTFTLNQGSFALTHELSDRWRIRQLGGLLVTSTIAAKPFPLADGLELDRRGIDGIQPFATTSLIHDIAPRETGDISVTYRYTYSPYSLDFTTNPPRAAGPQKIHQVIPDVGWTHRYSEYWLGISRLGLSIASPPNFSDNNRPVILPVASEELHFGNERWQFIGATSFSYGSVTPRLGSGPSLGGTGTLVGIPYSYGRFKRLVGLFNATASVSQLQAQGSAKTTLSVVGGSAEIRYPLYGWLGLIAGYDIRFSTIKTTGQDLVPYFRQIVFLGLSGYWTTDPGILPLQILDAPFKPG